MKFFSPAVAALVATAPLLTSAKQHHGHHKGFNLGANTIAGGCKTEHEWENEMRHMKKLPGNFNTVRVYAASDCDTLINAVPAAKRSGVKLLAGVWAEDADHYAAEKTALQNALNEHGTGWMVGLSVGSEDLYRKDTTAAALAGQVNEVRGIVHGYKGGKHIPIGHVDTWTEWVNPHSAVLIKAVDFLGMDGYPYYQGKKIDISHHTFYKSLHKTQVAADKHGKHKPVWITETGWPVSGKNDKAAHPSVKNARHYWKSTICGLFKTHHTFVYTLTPIAQKPQFGVLDRHFRPIFNLHCN